LGEPLRRVEILKTVEAEDRRGEEFSTEGNEGNEGARIGLQDYWTLDNSDQIGGL
jgi:hypothetical protein